MDQEEENVITSLDMPDIKDIKKALGLMDQEEENVTTLLSMGFPDVKEIRKALRLSKNDLNEAISILTSEHTIYSSLSDTYKDGKSDLSFDFPPVFEDDDRQQYENQGNGSEDNVDSKACNKVCSESSNKQCSWFPSANLYELESRVFRDQWSIPYQREESLGKCLIAATNLAQKALAEVDENCKRFLENCMPEAFRKLLTSGAVRSWGIEVQEGVYNMLQLFLDFITVRLKYDPVPELVLSTVLTMGLDPESEFHIRNKTRVSLNTYWNEFNTNGQYYAVSYNTKEPYGWLVNMINKFGEQDGFRSIQEIFEKRNPSPSAMEALLKPFSKCVKFLVCDRVGSYFHPCVVKAENYIRNLTEDELKTKNISVVSELLRTLSLLCQHFWSQEAESIADLHLSIILRMLKCSQFNARMNALKEISRLIEERFSPLCPPRVISAEKLLDWISDSKVLSLSLESNLDQVQYAEKINIIVDFLGPKLSVDDITKIWSIQAGQNIQTIDNILSIMAAAASKFNKAQFDHLLSLIQKSWLDGHDQSRKMLLCFLGRIGKETHQGKSSPEVLDLLWDLAHAPNLPIHLIEQALDEHVLVLNEVSAQKEQLRKVYIRRCIEDVKKGVCVLPCLKMLHNISSSVAQHGYQKQDKAMLHDLNKTHDLIKLVTTSISRNKSTVTTPSGSSLPPLSIGGDKYTHEEYVIVHLDFLRFILQEGSQYLNWNRAQDVWDALISNPQASNTDRETCFEWFTRSLQDLEIETQSQLFQQKILKLDASQITQKGFNCFKTYFESVNLSENKLRRFVNTLVVEKMDLIGLDFLWQVALDCPDELIAEYAIANILDISYHSLSVKLKKDPVSLHQKFSNECSKRLAAILPTLGTVNPSPVSAAVSCATKTLTAMCVSEAAALSSPSRTKGLRNIRRLLQLAECYVSSIEDLHEAPRTILPHGASFYGHPVTVLVILDSKDRQMNLQTHSNETFGSLRHRIAALMHLNEDQLQLLLNDAIVSPSKNQKLLFQMGFQDHQVIRAKPVGNLSSSTVTFASQGASSYASVAASTASVASKQSFLFEQEKMLPGVVMSTGGYIYTMLYQLVNLDDAGISTQVQNILYLLPTDPAVLNLLDAMSDQQVRKSLLVPSEESSSRPSSPLSSPKKQLFMQKESENPKDILKKLFDVTFTPMSSFCLLYNLQVLSGRLMPTSQDTGTIESSRHFCDDFLKADGLQVIVRLLKNMDISAKVPQETLHGCYFLALQIACYLLCGVSVVEVSHITSLNTFSSTRPETPKKTVADFLLSSTEAGGTTKTSVKRKSSQSIKTLPKEELVELMLSVMRISWTAAGGQAQILSSTKEGSPHFERGRQSSSRSTSSDEGQCGHGDVPSQQVIVSKDDARLANEVLVFLVTCFQQRPELFDSFVSLPRASDFVRHMILDSPSSEVRSKALEQFSKLCKFNSSLFATSQIPRHYLLNVLLTARVPLWLLSSITRPVNLRLVNQSKEFFDLLCLLISGASMEEQAAFNFDSKRMIASEIEWLQNFSPSEIASLKFADNTLLAGHLKLLQHLLTCEGVDKGEIDETLILDILNKFLFRASHLIVEELGNRVGSLRADLTPKCTSVDSRIAAYELLTQLAAGCSRNTEIIVNQLIKLHHHFQPHLAKEYEYEPLVAGRAPCGYVGLKNAGATCYMNSVIQQLYMQPGVREAILSIDDADIDEDSLFYQFQMVFGHLLESHLQYHIPDRFWKCFRLWGEPVNVREQQDAFEFFSHIIDQIDEYLKKHNHELVFKHKYEGTFSDQKICQGCPHRYEREESFMALNLPVKTNNLQDALDQFVKEETLEGDNAYFCEKCGEKRTAIKRTRIQNPPPVLVIQLKRFGYDWEANKAMKFDDYFKFPWMLDLKPYTVDSVTSNSGMLTDTRAEPPSGEGANQLMYELVGVVVHSGQANAGHYYSYIKERSLDSACQCNRGKWFKFNDITVEEFAMTDESLEAECFGGTYKAMVGGDSGTSYPETRQRYWNGYLLFYESRDDLNKNPWTPKKAQLQMSFRTNAGERCIKRAGTSGLYRHRDSLSQLTQLVDRGEKQGLFVDTMPARIQRAVRENNLQFMHNCDIYNDAYFAFIHGLIRANLDEKFNENQSLLVSSLNLSIHFLLNTYLRTRNKPTADWLDCVEMLIINSKEAAFWLIEYFSTDIGLSYIKPFLLECPNRELRQTFTTLLEKGFHYFFKHGGVTSAAGLNRILEHLLQMLNQDVADNCRNCSQYFQVLSSYAQLGRQACIHLFEKGAFQKMLAFLLSPVAADMEKEGSFPRRWGSSQVKEFGPLYNTLSSLILACDLVPNQTCSSENFVARKSALSPCMPDIPMPEYVRAALYGVGSGRFIHEIITACREISTLMLMTTDMLVQCCFCNEHFSFTIIKHLMLQYSSVPSNELRNLSFLLLEILPLEDPLQFTRIQSVIDGFPLSNDSHIDGMLDIIRINQQNDGRRSYQGMKFLVMLAKKCPLAKDYLIQTPGKWQWAVNWLKMMMSEHTTMTSQTITMLSNEDSNTKAFQRTVSAQDTLADATALLTELETPENQDIIMDVDDEDPSVQQPEVQFAVPSSPQRDRSLKRVKAMDDLDSILP